MFLIPACLFGALLVYGQTSQPASTTVDLNRYPPQPQETVCGDIVNANIQNQSVLFYASDVVQCLTSVPFNPAVALRFLRYVNQTFQFQVYTAYVRNPPAGYQQPRFDFFSTLQTIEDNVNAGNYHNQYAFELDVQSSLQRLHDSHVVIYGGISSQMTFLNSFNLVSVSADGKQSPEVYIWDDLIQSRTQGYSASPIDTINDMAAVDYLKAFASRQSSGMLEANADWNQLMYSPAQYIFGSSSFSDSAPFYPGDELNVTLKNGTGWSSLWYSLYESPGYTGPLETGGDFYNYFVLGLLPANFDEQATLYYQSQNQSQSDASDDDDDDDAGTPSNQTSWNSVISAYPAGTMIHQDDLGQFDNGYALTGYFLENSSTAVLSIPSFVQYNDAINTFGQALSDFIGNATDKGATHIIIDLQQNTGGLVGLVFATFDAFFPNRRPFAGSRMRDHPLADVLGQTLTSRYDALLRNGSDEDTLDSYIGSEWVVTDRINAQTGRNFSSWTEYRGPVASDGDDFTLTQRYDLSNPTFVADAFDLQYDDPCHYTATCNTTQAWKAEQIVILTDGICGSACSLFVEMMHEAGVRSVVVGGLPDSGPMQAASGTRAAFAYKGDSLDYDYNQTRSLSPDAATALSGVTNDTGMYLYTVRFSLRDQIRQNATVPNQMLYLPADCRLFWTLANFYDYERLWTDVYDAMFVDASLCVSGSTGVATAPAPPSYTAPSLQGSGSSSAQKSLAYYISHPGGVPSHDSGNHPPPATDSDRSVGPSIVFCDPNRPSGNGGRSSSSPCRSVPFPCGCRGDTCAQTKTFTIRTKQCQRTSACPGPLYCNTKSQIRASSQNVIGFRGNIGTEGFCEPDWGNALRQTRCDQVIQGNLNDLLNDSGYS